MAKKVSNTTPLFGNKRSHACNATRHAQKPNYQRVKTDNGETVVMTAREIRSAKKANAGKVNAIITARETITANNEAA